MMPTLLPLLLTLAVLRADSVDVLIKGGRVYDGSGKAGQVTDVGLRGDRIVFIGDAGKAWTATTTSAAATFPP
jgi:N-acyl-D-aspartate/D-glutamate deacylase